MARARTRVHPYIMGLVAAVGYLFCIGLQLASASDTLDAVDRGWWSSHGLHAEWNKNTLTGAVEAYYHQGVPYPSVQNSFFIFDLPASSETIYSGVLRLELTAYQSLKPTESLSLYDVSTSIQDLRTDLLNDATDWDNPFGQAIFADLGSGSVYGKAQVSAAQVGTVVEIQLSSSAISAINAHLGNSFAIGVSFDSIIGIQDQYIRFSDTQEPRILQLVLNSTPTPTPPPQILWQHQTTGSLSAWLMNGTSLASLATVTPNVVSDTNWKIVGIADFNNDGHPDILWQHQATGSLSAWLMNGTSLTTLATVTPGVVSDTNWKIVGIADFNNDGHPDILWQHQATGSLSAWLMNGTNLTALATVTPGVVSDTNWKIVGIADFNNDGHPDILWQHQATGSLSAWLMNGTNLTALATVNPGVVSDTNWKIVGIADFNNDGHPDILWQHQATGSLSAWLMNGTNLTALATVTRVW